MMYISEVLPSPPYLIYLKRPTEPSELLTIIPVSRTGRSFSQPHDLNVRLLLTHNMSISPGRSNSNSYAPCLCHHSPPESVSCSPFHLCAIDLWPQSIASVRGLPSEERANVLHFCSATRDPHAWRGGE